MENLYVGIRFFFLKKELPGCKIGDTVTIIYNDSDEYLWVNGIRMDYNTAEKYPEWFVPVKDKEFKGLFEGNTIAHLITHKKCSYDKALRVLANM